MSESTALTREKPGTMPGRNGGTLKRGGTIGPGRPRKITREHEKLLERELPAPIRDKLKPLGFKGKTWAAAYAFGAGLSAVDGDIPALKEITDRVEGKVKDEVELSGGLDLGMAISAAYDRTRE